MQLNRTGYKTDAIGLDSISDSMGYVHTADLICSLYQNEGDKESGILRLGMLKNRLGGDTTSQLEFNVNYKSLRITERKIDYNASTSKLDQTLVDDLSTEEDEPIINKAKRRGDIDKI